MRPFSASLLFVVFALLAAQGCSQSAQPIAQSATSNTVAAAPEAAPKKKPQACALVTAQEMSAILGSTVAAEPNEGSVDKTECIYKPADAPSPYVEFTVEWGDGAAITAMGAMGRMEQGLTNPYQGIGDQAVAVGTGLMIRTGDDLVTIMFSGVDDAPAKAKKIFDTAKAGM